MNTAAPKAWLAHYSHRLYPQPRFSFFSRPEPLGSAGVLEHTSLAAAYSKGLQYFSGADKILVAVQFQPPTKYGALSVSRELSSGHAIHNRKLTVSEPKKTTTISEVEAGIF